MGRKNLRTLVNINMLYVNPVFTAKLYKGKKGKAILESSLDTVAKKLMVRSVLFTSIIMILIYGNFYLLMDLKKMAYLMDLSLVLFMAVNVVSGISYYFNVFYESRDVEFYMALPVSEKQVYLSKVITLLISTIPMCSVYLPLFGGFLYKNGYGALSILYSILIFLLLLFFTVAIQLVLAGAMSGISILANHRKGVQIFANTFSTVVVVGLIIWMQKKSVKLNSGEVVLDHQITGPISRMILGRGGVFIFMVLCLIPSLAVWFLYINRMEGNFYNQVRKNMLFEGEKKAKKKASGKQKVRVRSKGMAMLSYHMGFLKEQSVISMSVIMPALMPAVMIGNILFQAKEDVDKFMDSGIGVAAIMGTMMAVLAVGAGSNLGTVIYSLEGRDYDYIRSLPINRKSYFRFKQTFSAVCTSVVPFILMIIGAVYMGAPAAFIIVMVISFMAVAYEITGLWMIYDIKHLVVEYENISEIYGRMSRAMNAIIFTVYMFCIIITTVFMVFLSDYISKWIGLMVPVVTTAVIAVINLRRNPTCLRVE